MHTCTPMHTHPCHRQFLCHDGQHASPCMMVKHPPHPHTLLRLANPPQAAQAELALTECALRKNPKSYSAWHHRRWVVQHRLTSLEHEIGLVTKYVGCMWVCWVYMGVLGVWVCWVYMDVLGVCICKDACRDLVRRCD